MAPRAVFGGVWTHVTSVSFFEDVHSVCVSTGVSHSNTVPLSCSSSMQVQAFFRAMACSFPWLVTCDLCGRSWPWN
jgi:hypothetical protein